MLDFTWALTLENNEGLLPRLLSHPVTAVSSRKQLSAKEPLPTVPTGTVDSQTAC